RNIRAAFPNRTFFVTGDSSGNRGDITMKDPHATYYKFIQGYLGLGDKQLHLNNYNLRHGVSRTLINNLLGSYPGILISNEACPLLINDCITARVDDSSNLPGA